MHAKDVRPALIALGQQSRPSNTSGDAQPSQQQQPHDQEVVATISEADEAPAPAADNRPCSTACGNRTSSSGCSTSGRRFEGGGTCNGHPGGDEQLCGDGSFDASCGMYKLYARRSYARGEFGSRNSSCKVAKRKEKKRLRKPGPAACIKERSPN
eukprot:1160358-Pelagomonas_calceolata.AAC.5